MNNGITYRFHDCVGDLNFKMKLNDDVLYTIGNDSLDIYTNDISLLKKYALEITLITHNIHPFKSKDPEFASLQFIEIKRNFDRKVVNAVTIIDTNTKKKTTDYILSDGIEVSPCDSRLNDIINQKIDNIFSPSKMYSSIKPSYTVKFKKIKTIAGITYFNAFVKIKKDKNYWSNYV